MKKKSIFLVGLSVLGVLSSCVTKEETVYGKTYVYGTYSVNYEDTFNNETLNDLIENNLNSINWKKSLGDTAFDESITTLARAKEVIENKASSYFTSNFASTKFIVGTEDEKKLTISHNNTSVDFTIEEHLVGDTVSKYYFKDSTGNQQGSFAPEYKDGKFQFINITCEESLGLPMFQYSLEMYLNEEESFDFIIVIKSGFVVE